MRNISFVLTEEQVLACANDVTHRLGWRRLKPGQELRGCRKCKGIPKGGHVEQIVHIRVVSVRFEPLRRLTDELVYSFEEIRRRIR